jgi:predicted transcriptional regulator
MTSPSNHLKIGPDLTERILRFAEARHCSPDSIVRSAINQYLEREENHSEKKYPPRNPVGGIITPV